MSLKKRNAKKYAVQIRATKEIQDLKDQIQVMQSSLDSADWRATRTAIDNASLEAELESLQAELTVAREDFVESRVALDLLQVQLDATKGQLATSIRACNASSAEADKYYRLYEAAQELAESQAIGFYHWKDKLCKQVTYSIPLTFAAGGLLGLVSMYFQLGV